MTLAQLSQDSSTYIVADFATESAKKLIESDIDSQIDAPEKPVQKCCELSARSMAIPKYWKREQPTQTAVNFFEKVIWLSEASERDSERGSRGPLEENKNGFSWRKKTTTLNDEIFWVWRSTRQRCTIARAKNIPGFITLFCLIAQHEGSFFYLQPSGSGELIVAVENDCY